MENKCAGCLQQINNRRFLKCKLCAQLYDIECANVPEQRFYNTMTKEHKQNWLCPLCFAKKPKVNNQNTPCKQQENANTTTNYEESSFNADDDIPHITGDENVTMRHKKLHNCVDESLMLEDYINSSEGEETLTDTLSLKTLSPEVNISEEDVLTKLQLQIIQLQEKLKNAEDKIECLTLENDSLKNKLIIMDRKIDHLEKNKTNDESSKKTVTDIGHQTVLDRTQSISVKQRETKADPRVGNNRVMNKDSVCAESHSLDRHKLCLISSHKQCNILSKAKINFSNNYDLCHYLMPYCGIKHQLKGLKEKLNGYTMKDYCVIFIGEEDFRRTNDYVDLTILIRNTLLPLNHTNIIICLPTFKIGNLTRMYNCRIEHFNNLLYLDTLTHEHVYLIDSNRKLTYDNSMFNLYTGNINDHGMNTVFLSLTTLIADIENFVNNEFFL